MAPAIVLSALAARIWSLVTRPLWFDELYTILVSRAPIPESIESLRRDSGPALFYALQHPAVRLAEAAGLPDWTARLLPFLASAAIFAGAFSLAEASARRRFLILAATSPLLFAYAAEARAYALLSLLGLALFLLVLRGASRAALAGIVLLTAAMLHTHYLALFSVLALAIVALAMRRRASAAAIVAGSLLFLPWVPILARQPVAATSWMREATLDSALGFLSALGGAGRIPIPFGGPLPALLLLSGFGVGAALAFFLSRSGKDGEVAAALAVVGLTLGGVLIATVWRPVAFSGRTEMAVLPVWLWALAKGSERSAPLRALLSCAAAVGALSIGFLMTEQSRAASPYDPAVAALGKLSRRGDVAIAVGPFYLPVRLAAERGEIAASVAAFPPELESHPGWMSRDAASAGDAGELRRAIDRCAGDCRLLVATPDARLTESWETAMAGWGRKEAVWRGGTARITLWTPRAPPLPPR